MLKKLAKKVRRKGLQVPMGEDRPQAAPSPWVEREAWITHLAQHCLGDDLASP